MSDLEKRFAAAQEAVNGLPDRPDDDSLLELYSYCKQASEGDVSGVRPGAFDFVARAKYDAWAGRKGMHRDVAMRGYVRLVEHPRLLET